MCSQLSPSPANGSGRVEKSGEKWDVQSMDEAPHELFEGGFVFLFNMFCFSFVNKAFLLALLVVFKIKYFI